MPLFIGIVAALAISGLLYIGFDKDMSTIELGGVGIEVEIADTPELRSGGLSARESLPSDQGMLFVFESSDFHSFYMRDMNFPIDIIWMDDDFQVIDISKNLPPESYPELFRPQVPSRYVLEVVAGFADSHQIEIGDQAQVEGLSFASE